ncbi:MAG: type II secretion system minor pseudopilin GspH [Candidatus Competibacteraceae bacterium]|nr:type II secretion system minor pseudopilin GspH [Candidatus Competibacteraceae bacterium]
MSAAGRLTNGFTLLEVMVVLVLIGIITSFALLAVSGGSQERLAEEAQRLAALVELHQQEAIMSGEPRGIRFSRTGYAVLSLGENGKWHAPTAAATLIRHQLPEDINLGLWVEGRPAELNAAGDPQVVLLNSGETTEFVTVFSLADERGPDAPLYRVAGDLLGRLTVGAGAR